MNPYIISAIVLWVYFTIIFLVAQRLKNNSIVDSFWGPAFLLVAIASLLADGSLGVRAVVLAFLVALWAFRLFLYITIRNWNKPEDYRYINHAEKMGDIVCPIEGICERFSASGHTGLYRFHPDHGDQRI